MSKVNLLILLLILALESSGQSNFYYLWDTINFEEVIAMRVRKPITGHTMLNASDSVAKVGYDTVDISKVKPLLCRIFSPRSKTALWSGSITGFLIFKDTERKIVISELGFRNTTDGYYYYVRKEDSEKWYELFRKQFVANRY